MKSTTMFAIASVLTAVSAASGQTPAPAAPAPAAPPPAASAAPVPPTPAPKLEQKPPVRAARVSIVDADARNCLEFSRNQEIIKCAEKYLHRRAG
jgi:hypothetical protein